MFAEKGVSALPVVDENGTICILFCNNYVLIVFKGTMAQTFSQCFLFTLLGKEICGGVGGCGGGGEGGDFI